MRAISFRARDSIDHRSIEKTSCRKQFSRINSDCGALSTRSRRVAWPIESFRSITMSLTQHNVEDFVMEFFATKNPYQKYYSPENLNKIVGRVASFGIHPSSTAVKRAILDLVEEDQIDRTNVKADTNAAR